MAFSTSHANSVLDAAPTMDISLHTADPGSAGATAEVVGGSYARQSATFGAASSGSNTTTNVVTFAGMPAATVTHMAEWVGGTCKYTGPLTSSFVVTAGQSIQFAAGEITNTLT